MGLAKDLFVEYFLGSVRVSRQAFQLVLGDLWLGYLDLAFYSRGNSILELHLYGLRGSQHISKLLSERVVDCFLDPGLGLRLLRCLTFFDVNLHQRQARLDPLEVFPIGIDYLVQLIDLNYRIKNLSG